ncbi:MAG: hypothetical protein ACE5PM_06225 [Candidatus Hydrothermarchaeales archaeon]
MFNLILLLFTVFLPGLCWLFALGFWRDMKLLELISISIGLSIAFISLFSAFLAYFDLFLMAWPFWLLLGGCFVYVAVYIRGNHPLRLNRDLLNLSLTDFVVLYAFLLHVILLLSYFYKYPVFHGTWSGDPLIHSSHVKNIVNLGGGSLIRGMPYPLGLHFVLGFVARFLGGELLMSVRYGVAFIEALGILLVYSAGLRMSEDKRLALFSSLTYALILVPGLFHLASSGTYSNLFGDFNTLLTFYLILVSMKHGVTLKSGLSLVFVGLVLAFSHSTVFIFFTFLWIFIPLVLWVYRDLFRRYVTSTFMLSISPIIVFLLFPWLILRLTWVLRGGFISIRVRNPVYDFFEAYAPKLLVLGSFSLTTGLWLFFAVLGSILLIFKFRRNIWYVFTLGLFLYAVALSSQGLSVWRFARYMLLPSTFLLGFLLLHVYTQAEKRFSKLLSRKSLSEACVKGSIFAIIMCITLLGPTYFFMLNNALEGGEVRLRQEEIFDSMLWIRDGTPLNATFISVWLPEYRYLSLVADRKWLGNYDVNAMESLELCGKKPFQYVAIWKGYDGLSGYIQGGFFKKVYENSQIVIMGLKAQNLRV